MHNVANAGDGLWPRVLRDVGRYRKDCGEETVEIIREAVVGGKWY